MDCECVYEGACGWEERGGGGGGSRVLEAEEDL